MPGVASCATDLDPLSKEDMQFHLKLGTYGACYSTQMAHKPVETS